MKKFLISGLALISSFAFAEDSKKEVTTQNQPVAEIRVFDISGSEPKLMKGNQLSRTKQRQLCITLANLPVQDKNLFAEYFQAPAPMAFSIEGANTQVDSNQHNTLLTMNIEKSDLVNNTLSQCWKFNKQNPIGIYKLDLQFNDLVFKGLEFEILK